MDWAKRDHSDGALVIWGPVGTGKSALAAATLRYMIAAHGRAGFWAPTRKIVNAIRSSLYGKDRSAAEELTQALGTVEVLALDDLGWEHATEWASDLIDGVIDDRYNARKITICTTNEDPRKAGTLSGRIGQRSASRLLHGATVIRINGPDLRVA